MKLRIQDNSIRYRITLQELEELEQNGRIERTCETPWGKRFHYAITATPERESRVEIGSRAVIFHLGSPDFQQLRLPTSEGIYVRREWMSDEGTVRRMIAFVEKDRPATSCEKPEAWIYEPHGVPQPSVRLIPRQEKGQ